MKTTCYGLSFLFILSLQACNHGHHSACTPTCDGKQCGDDQCGGTCQPGCDDDETCSVAGHCISCTSNCDGKECGSDGCSGQCPPGCGSNETCDAAGQCVSTAVDNTPPSPIADLTASNPTQNSITLTWTAPGDDAATGVASGYDIRYSTASVTDANWASATRADNEPAPLVSGTSQSHIVSGLTADTTYYLAIRATDDAGHVSDLSNIAAGKTLADTGVYPFYPADFYWNVPVDRLPVDSRSQAYTDTMVRYDEHLYAWRNATINIVDASTPRRELSYQLWGSPPDQYNLYQYGDQDILYPIHSTLLWSGAGCYETPATNPDCWSTQTDYYSNGENMYIILDPATDELWEIYDGRLDKRCVGEVLVDSPGDMCAVIAMKFDLTSYALRPFGYPSCSVSGLDPVPGIVRKAEIQAGVINHAIGASLYHMHDSYVWPSSRGGTHQNPAGDTYPPNGQRFRLKASFDISGYTRDQQVVLTALKKYGFLAMENSNRHEITLNFEKDIAGFSYDTFSDIGGSDLEAVDFSSLMISSDSGQCDLSRIP